MSSSDNEEEDTLQELQENAVRVYHLLGHLELIRYSPSTFTQVCDELEAIYRNDGIWMRTSKKVQLCIAEGTAAAIKAAGSVSVPAESQRKLDYLGRTAIRSMLHNKKLQKKHKTHLSNLFRDVSIMSRRRQKHDSKVMQLPFLPPELYAVIFGFLTSPIDLARCRSVCTEWLHVCDSFSDVLWPRHLRAMVGSKEAQRLLPVSADVIGPDTSPCAAMKLVSSQIDANDRLLDPFKYKRFIVQTPSDGYFLRQMSEATFQRLLHEPSENKGLHERRCFVSPAEVAAYIARPFPSTLKELVRQRRV